MHSCIEKLESEWQVSETLGISKSHYQESYQILSHTSDEFNNNMSELHILNNIHLLLWILQINIHSKMYVLLFAGFYLFKKEYCIDINVSFLMLFKPMTATWPYFTVTTVMDTLWCGTIDNLTCQANSKSKPQKEKRILPYLLGPMC